MQFDPTLKYANWFERLFHRPLFHFAFPTATPAGTDSGAANIDALLGADLGTPDTSTADGEDTSVAVAEPEVEVEPETGSETTEAETEAEDAETVDAEGEPEEETAEEVEEELSELETDFSDATYQRAAEHWAKRGVQLELSNPGHKAFLKDWMERGQKIKELQTAQAEPEEETEEEAPTTTEPAAPTKTPQEMLQERVKNAREYAKSQIVPEVAMEFSKGIVNALWPGKDVKLSQEQANALAETFSTFAILQITDAIPSILNAAPKAVASQYPHFERMHEMATREAATDEMLGATDKATGQPLYPNFERLVESGAIKAAMNSAELKDAVFQKDPYKNLIAKLKVAYKMANNERVTPGLIEKAVARGREQANARARQVAAGKLPPGRTRSGTAPGSRSSEGFMQGLIDNTGGNGSRFGRLIRESRANR